MSRPPGPGARAALRLARDREQRPQLLAQVARKYGDVVHLGAGPAGFYLISHPELTHGILAEHHERFERAGAERRYSRWLLGDSVFTSEGALHERQRALIEPHMYGEAPAQHAQDVVEVTARTIEGWRAGEVVDTLEHHERMITLVMVKVLFGASGDRGEEIADAIFEAIHANHKIPFAPTRIPRRLPLPSKRRFARALARLHGLIERAAEAGAAPVESENVLSRLVRTRGNGAGMSPEQARDEALALYRGQNTVAASALSWGWYLLSRHPEAEARFHAEIDALGRDPSYEDLVRLPYPLMVLREALRLYPPAWAIARMATAPHPVREYEIPRGKTVVMSTWVHHRDPRFWQDPERFDPERFAGGIPADLPRCAYFPQGAGAHRCLGMDFLPVEMVMVLATIGRRWRLRPASDDPAVPLAKASLVPRGGMPMVLEARR